MNKDFANNVYQFCDQLFEQFLEGFKGKEVGSDECNKKVIMDKFFDKYVPGKKVKKNVMNKKKKLSGYTFFGQENKDLFNKEINEISDENNGEKIRFVKYQSNKWKELNDEEREEWNVKANEFNIQNDNNNNNNNLNVNE